MPYCSTSDVLRKAGITTSEVSAADVLQYILEAEGDVDKFTNTTYWAVEKEAMSVDSSTDSTLTDAAGAFGVASEHVGNFVWVYSGTGINQIRKIISHTNTVLTLDADWTVNPVAADGYRIIHCGTDPRRTEYRDGDNTRIIFTQKYPVRRLDAVTIESKTITASTVTVYSDTGQLYLGNTAESAYWTSVRPQKNIISYWFGVYTLPMQVRNLTALYAARGILAQQMGGTFDDPSSVQLPEGSVTVGQAYINIRGTIDMIEHQIKDVEAKIQKYFVFG